jgi:hypothetical protein
MGEINHIKFFVLCKIMWYDVVMIYLLLNDVDILHIKIIILNNL